jgi:hypothetical protein
MHIINNAKKEKRIKLKNTDSNYIYYEKHHILPKSIFSNWKKEEKNMVLLTAKEHFICHLLLQKIYKCTEIRRAFLYMSNYNKLNSKQYLLNKKNYYGYSYKWYNDGKINFKIKINEEIPNGFAEGYIRIKDLKKTPKIYLRKNKKKGKRIVELNSKIIYESIQDAIDRIGLSKNIINKSLNKRIPVDNQKYMFSLYKDNINLEILRNEYLINLQIPYRKIKEKYTNKIYKNLKETERITGISRYFIIKSLRQNIPYCNCLFQFA